MAAANTNNTPTDNIVNALQALNYWNTLDLRDNIGKVSKNSQNISLYFQKSNFKDNQALIDSGLKLEKIERKLEKRNNIDEINNTVKAKLKDLLKELNKRYNPNDNIYLYNNNLDNRIVGRGTRRIGNVERGIPARIKKAVVEGKRVEVPRHDLSRILIIYWSENRGIRYITEEQSLHLGKDQWERHAEYVNKNDYLVLDNHYTPSQNRNSGFDPFRFEEVEEEVYDEIEDVHYMTYHKHLYSYIHFEEELKYYLNKVNGELENIKADNGSYYRLIFYHYESVKTLDKMFLQRIQMSAHQEFFSAHSWFHARFSWFGTKSSKGYYNLLTKYYDGADGIMGDLKRWPRRIITKLETQFSERIERVMEDNDNDQFRILDPVNQVIIMENQQKIKRLRDAIVGTEGIWDAVRED